VQHGTRDSVIPVQCSINLAARLAQVASSDTVQLELLEGADHADPRFEAADNVQKVLDFLDKHLKGA
jgi:dipeptidyl aminopeptidase/acylaminoacyl peptidase